MQSSKCTLARLRWQCRRGMLELDILLVAFSERHYESLSSEDQLTFIELLTFPDQVLYQWLIGSVEPEDHKFKIMCDSIRINTWNE